MRSDSQRNRFVADGRDRAIQGIEAEIRAEVLREYAERLAAASKWQQARLTWEIEREIKRRVAAAAPPREALY